MFSLKLCLLLGISFYIVLVESQNAVPLVRTAYGLVAGSWRVSAGGRPFASFQGIPFAKPPAGKRRFREPQRLKPWSGTWDGTDPGPVCLQYDPFVDQIIGSENCLFLNVYTPDVNINAASNLPVVVFVHGGAFMYGSGKLYDPVHLMDKDMIVVTLNYRLGPLGFLSTGDDIVPGNMGLKDQNFALQWIRDNIMMFGGDSANVVIMGCSAGGASVHYHYLSPLSRGLFHRGIALSGSSFASWTHATDPAQKARGLAAHIGCPTTTSREMVDCMRSRPAESIVNAQSIYFDWKVAMFTPFRPTTEPATSRTPFLSQHPYHAARSGQAAPLPLIATVTSEEGLYPAAAYMSEPGLLSDLETHWVQLSSNIFEFNDTLPASQKTAVANRIKEYYLQGKPVSAETFPLLVQALGDRLFASGVGKAAQMHAARSGQPVYVYRYSFRGEKSLSNLMAGDDNDYGVSHADDLFHMFGFPGLEMSQPQDEKMRRILIDMIYSFASTGTPKINGVTWPPLVPGSAEINYIEIHSPEEISNKTTQDFGQKSFWDSLGFAENENYHLAMRDEL